MHSRVVRLRTNQQRWICFSRVIMHFSIIIIAQTTVNAESEHLKGGRIFCPKTLRSNTNPKVFFAQNNASFVLATNNTR
jgi:hypothetical protein